MPIKSSDQITIVDLTDAYSVVLTNESHTFIGDRDSVNGTQSTNIGVMALRGAEQINAVVGTVTPPTGITVSSDGKTPVPTLTVTASSAVTSGGTITIPITLDNEITINKVFSYSIAFTGATGATGGTGATGKGVKSTVITYQIGTSGTTPPSGSWVASIPAASPGQYLWTRTTTTYTDNTSVTAYSVALQGLTGDKGNTGATGATGVGVKTTTITYQASSSGTTVPTGTWGASIPNVTPGQYLWTRTVLVYTDNSSSTGYSVAKQGEKGNTGAAGADAITLAVTSSNGYIFKNASIATTLTAHVYKAGVEVTGSALTALGTIKWYKDGSTTASGTGSTLSISAGDITNKASYIAQLEA